MMDALVGFASVRILGLFVLLVRVLSRWTGTALRRMGVSEFTLHRLGVESENDDGAPHSGT